MLQSDLLLNILKAFGNTENNPWKLRGAITCIRQTTENLVPLAIGFNDVATRSLLENTYGKSFFRCNFPRCKSYMEGFPTKEGRDVHLNQHSRPFKCNAQYCPYSTVGFPDDGALAQHTADKHVSDGADLSELLSALAIEDNARPEASIGVRRPDLLDIFRDALLSENTSIVLACFNDVSFQQAVTEEGLSMLHFACAFDSRCVALTLLDAGAPIDFKCTKRCNIDTDSTVSLGVEIGDTPLHVTARLGHETITKLLVDRGANVNAENHGKDIPLYIASSLGHQTVARILLEAQANAEALTISDETEETPIKTSILRLMGKLKVPSTSQEMGAEIRKLREKLEVRRRARLRRTVSTLTNAIQAQGFYPAQQNQLEQQRRHATMLQQNEHIVNARAHASNFPPNSSSPQPPLAVLDGSFVAPQPGAPFPPQPAGTPQQAVARPIIRTPEC